MIEITRKTYVEALNQIAATDAGKVVLAVLKDSCAWDTTFVDSNDPVKTHAYAYKRGVYGALRRDIKVGHLKKIEHDYNIKTEKAATNGITRGGNSRRTN